MKNKWFPNDEWFSDGADGEGRPPKRPNFPFRINKPLILLILLVGIVIVVLPAFADFYTDLIWFRARGLSEVFWVRLLPQWIIFLITGAVAFILLWLNYGRAAKISRPLINPDVQRFIGTRFGTILVLAVAGIFAIGNGLAARGNWAMVLRFINGSPFGHVDSLFGHDVGFYVFTLPFIAFLQSWLLNILILCLLGSSVIYVAAVLPSIQQERRFPIPRPAQIHLTLLGFFIILTWAAGYWIQRYYLLYSSRGVAFGASYTDVHADLLALNVMAILTVVVALLLLVSIFRSKTWKFSIGLVVLLLATNMILRGLYPGIIQKYVVEPNEFSKERPYIEHNIQATLDAYGLSDLKTRTMVPDDEITSAHIQNNPETIRNIRLWDYSPLLRTFKQLQEIRSYYDFVDVDIDRYALGDEYRQVILSARELDLKALQNPTWVNMHLEFTHGYGIVMNPVNEIGPSGLPVLWIRDLPPKISVPLEIERPEIYYGEKPSSYVFVKTTVKEFDYPMGESNMRTTYQGKGGVSIGSIWRRLLFTASLGDTKILFTNVFTPESKILLYRNIRERLHHVAPFLLYDSDPYLTVMDGRLVWILDAYTVTDRYPYSELVSITGNTEFKKINYIRNSVKATVDAYDGSMAFYVTDPEDPMIQTWSKIFSGLFKPMTDMPETMRAHLRYPKGLFEIQSEIFRTYHMDDPNTFYNKEDVWEVSSRGDRTARLDAYYVIMRLNSEEKAEFMLISPFMPIGRDNMIAWIAGRCDGDNYGELLVYQFPKQKLIYGPSQIEALTDQNPEISAQLSLWSQRGSDVIRGHMLVIPIENALLYVQPLYLRAETSDLPELKRVIVSTGGRVVWGETLQIALQRLVGQYLPGEEEPVEKVEGMRIYTGQEDVRDLARIAEEHWEAAQEALKIADWESYGQEMEQLEQVLKQLLETTKERELPETVPVETRGTEEDQL